VSMALVYWENVASCFASSVTDSTLESGGRWRVHVGRRVPAFAPYESDQDQAAGNGGVDRQRARCAHRGDEPEAGRPGLLHDLEARPARDPQAGVVREPGLEQVMPDHLVDRV